MDRSQGPIGKLVGGVTSGIGFASEVYGYKKSRKAAIKERELKQHDQGRQQESASASASSSSSSSFRSPPPYSATEFPLGEQTAFPTEKTATIAEDEIERSWQLDEAQDVAIEESEPSKPRKSKSGVANPDKVISAFLQRQPPPYPTLAPDGRPHPDHRLAYPVAIPQRRPKDKTRGFIRAYAPDLQNMGITQETWFDLIETINEASLANPWINALNLASLAAAPLPFLVSTAISMAIMVSTTIAIETQGRYRQNKALDTLNKEFFNPRGLFCLVMTWDPTSTSARTNMDINSTIQSTVSTQGKKSHKFQSSNGVTNGMEYMQTAELVFPGLDWLATATADERKGFKMKFKRGKGFIDDYMDRKAQAKFIAENPDSYLNQAGKPKFISKLADPSHPLRSGLAGLQGAGAGSGVGTGQSRGFGSRDDQGRGLGGRSGGLLGGGLLGGGLLGGSRGSGRGDGLGGGLLGGNRGSSRGGGLLGLVSLATNAVSEHRHKRQSQSIDSNLNSNNHSNPHAPYGGSDAGYYDERREQQRPYRNGDSRPEYYDERRDQQRPYRDGDSRPEYYDERRERQRPYRDGDSRPEYYDERRDQQRPYRDGDSRPEYYDERRDQQRPYRDGDSRPEYYDERRDQQRPYRDGDSRPEYYDERRDQQRPYRDGDSRPEYYDERRDQQRPYRDGDFRPEYYDERREQQPQNTRGGAGAGGLGGLSLNSLFRSKVLYLLVVNLPTEEELAEARRLTADWNTQTQQQQI
ncbi:hypothetical protein BO70DRAFT_357779 [Aspergillus heteromorphus CBS 117.55]|uniref:Uncharacterized protein n=1 Tax=Aspergillus heteromorphus CBS 117.55 TaxID=1448321 RepID=A0A317X208_9EURO|nr:uncharacterized protein BO70DRAFT_357779 [Aspergillus heteromorphus CBS 117.55]PWY92639.1 hypothetical protein BO70DRAFT_357779 [Aspergillus heteromorphus CBS 117.55]